MRGALTHDEAAQCTDPFMTVGPEIILSLAECQHVLSLANRDKYASRPFLQLWLQVSRQLDSSDTAGG